MKKHSIVACIAAGMLLLHACAKTKDEPATYNPVAASIAVPDFVTSFAGDMKVPADNPLTVDGIILGRKLFYEKLLSNNNSISCATCHNQAEGFDDKRPFSQGTNGAFGNRNAMPIVNLAYSSRFFWDGRRNSLEGQAHDPVTNPIEMAEKWPVVVGKLQMSSNYADLFYKAFGTRIIDSTLVVKAIAQFERTLVSFNSRFDKYYYLGDSMALTAQEKNGLALFTGKGMCDNCHRMNTLFTDNMFRNNGLDVAPRDGGLMKFTGLPSDNGKFKVSTLRNIAETSPYMHDSRFATLEEVVEHYSSGIKENSPNLDEHMPAFGSGLNLTPDEKSDLVAFMRSLSDTAFLNNAAFSDPG
jgi:cytochrome c peroxidase